MALLMTSEELLTKLKAGDVFNVNEVYSEMYIAYLEELQVYKKALKLMSEELAFNKHCTCHPYCYIKEIEKDCTFVEECHNSKWLFDYYLQKVREDNV